MGGPFYGWAHLQFFSRWDLRNESARNVLFYQMSVTFFLDDKRGTRFLCLSQNNYWVCFMKRISKKPGLGLKRPPKPGTTLVKGQYSSKFDCDLTISALFHLKLLLGVPLTPEIVIEGPNFVN